MSAQLDNALSVATLSPSERRIVERLVDGLVAELGDDLRGIWLYGSRARGENPHPDSDVDLMVIADGGRERYSRVALDLSFDTALAEGESPFAFSVQVHDPEWLRGRREIRSFFIQEVDRDKLVLAGSALD